ncbi:unnamed protein product, partial [marine sediment metagenome]
PLSPKAQWRIGDHYLRLKKYNLAHTAFQRVVDKYPDSIQAPISLLTIGNIYAYHQDEKEKAKKAYQRVLADYPDVKIPWQYEIIGIPGKINQEVTVVKAHFLAEEFLEDLE